MDLPFGKTGHSRAPREDEPKAKGCFIMVSGARHTDGEQPREVPDRVFSRHGSE